MEEILNKMKELLKLKEDKNSMIKSENEIKTIKNEIEKNKQEKNFMLINDALRNIKEEEIENKTKELKEKEAEVRKQRENITEKLEQRKKELMTQIDEELYTYKKKTEIDEMKKEIDDREKTKNIYQKLVENAQKTIEKIQKDLLEGKDCNTDLLKSAQEEKKWNLEKIEKIEKEIGENKNELGKYKVLEDCKQEYSELEYLRMRISGIGYENIEKLEGEISKFEKTKAVEAEVVEEKVKKPEELDTAAEKGEPINKKSENIKTDELPGDKTENISKIPFEIARIPNMKREKVITGNIQDLSDYYKEADLKILIDEKTKTIIIYYKNNTTGKILDSEMEMFNFKDINAKRKLYKKLGIGKMCKEYTEGNLEALKLKRKLNPDIINALNDNKEMIREYIKAIQEEKELPFELTHSLEKLNGIQKFIKERRASLKAEEKCGAKIVGRLFNKNKTIEDSKTEKLDDDKTVEDEYKGRFKHATKEGKKELEKVAKMQEKYKITNNDNHIEENANKSMEEKGETQNTTEQQR